MSASRCSEHRRAMSTNSCWPSFRPESASSPVMAKIPFIGVRSSWLITARKSVLARLISSADSFAARNALSDSLRLVASARMRMVPDSWPPGSCKAAVHRLTSTGDPSFRMPTSSRPFRFEPFRFVLLKATL